MISPQSHSLWQYVASIHREIAKRLPAYIMLLYYILHYY